MNEHSDHRSLNWSLKINSGLTGIRPLAFGTTRRIGRQLYCTFFTLLWHFEKLLWRWEVNTASSREIVIFPPFFTFASPGGNVPVIAHTMQLEISCRNIRSICYKVNVNQLERLKRVRKRTVSNQSRGGGGGLPCDRGGDARHLSLRCKFQISVSLRVFWAKHHYI